MAEDDAHDDDDVVVEARVRLTESDFFEAFQHVPQFAVWRSWLWCQPLGGLLLLVASPMPMARSWPYALACAGGVLPFFVFVRWLRRRWADQAFAHFGPRQVSFRLDRRGFELTSSLGRERHEWLAMERVVHSAQATLLFPSARKLYLLPRRALDARTAQAVDELMGEVEPRPRSGLWRKLLLVWLVALGICLLLFR